MANPGKKAADESGKNETETTNTEGETKKRGRQPDKLYYTCAAIKSVPKKDADGNVVKEGGKTVYEPTLLMDEFEAPSSEDKEAAFKLFQEKYGVKVQSYIGPRRQPPKVSAKTTEKRSHVNVPMDQIKMSGKRWSAVYEGWNVIAMGLNSFKDEKGKVEYNDDDVVLMLIGECAGDKEKFPKPRFGAKPATVLRTALTEAKLDS